MKQIIFAVIVMTLSACANQLMKQSMTIEPGMSKEQLLATMDKKAVSVDGLQ